MTCPNTWKRTRFRVSLARRRGYVGFEQSGKLSEDIARHPAAVLLFDEIEKAHPDIFNIFLQIMDYGVLTDAQGRHADFKNAVLIMTSNAGAREMERGLGRI